MPIRKLSLRLVGSRCVELNCIFIYSPYLLIHILNENKYENTVIMTAAYTQTESSAGPTLNSFTYSFIDHIVCLFAYACFLNDNTVIAIDAYPMHRLNLHHLNGK